MRLSTVNVCINPGDNCYMETSLTRLIVVLFPLEQIPLRVDVETHSWSRGPGQICGEVEGT